MSDRAGVLCPSVWGLPVKTAPVLIPFSAGVYCPYSFFFIVVLHRRTHRPPRAQCTGAVRRLMSARRRRLSLGCESSRSLFSLRESASPSSTQYPCPGDRG